MTSKWPLRRIVEVDWIDAASRGRWQNADEHRKAATPIACRSVGYLLTSDSQRVTVIQSQGVLGDVSDSMTIPRRMVLRMRTIGKVR